jgi:hypothetical protein
VDSAYFYDSETGTVNLQIFGEISRFVCGVWVAWKALEGLTCEIWAVFEESFFRGAERAARAGGRQPIR